MDLSQSLTVYIEHGADLYEFESYLVENFIFPGDMQLFHQTLC